MVGVIVAEKGRDLVMGQQALVIAQATRLVRAIPTCRGPWTQTVVGQKK